MDSSPELGRIDPWRESLERSLARRARSRRSRAAVPRSRMPALGPRGVAAITLSAALLASALAHHGPQGAPAPARADVPRVAPNPPAGAAATGAGRGGSGGCALAVAPAGYVNPLIGASVKPERIDQGVDYAGSGTLVAMGYGRVTYVATSDTGWPGAFIEYQLLDGADAGCYVFYAEGVIPADGLRVGTVVARGQPIATIIPKYPTGIEIGWGAGKATKAYAKVAGQWSVADDQNDVATAAGQSFSALIAALGGPPGIVEG